MTCQWIKERKYFHFIYYRATSWIGCVVWPWFQVHFLRRRIVRWKLIPPKIILLDPDREIKLLIPTKDGEKAG